MVQFVRRLHVCESFSLSSAARRSREYIACFGHCYSEVGNLSLANPMDPMDRKDDEGAAAVVLGKEEAEEAQCTVVAVVPRNAEAGKRPTPDAQESSSISSRTERQPLPKAPEGTKALRFLLFPTQGWHFLFFCAVFFSGLVYLHENAPSLEEIDHVLRADVRQPYTLKFVLNLIASVVNDLERRRNHTFLQGQSSGYDEDGFRSLPLVFGSLRLVA